MKKISVLLLALVMSGCGSGGGDSNTSAPVPQGQYQASPGLVQVYKDTEACVGFSAPPPASIRVVWQAQQPPHEYRIVSSVVLYGTDTLDMPPQHEFVHYLLNAKNGDADVNHASVFFTLKAAGGCI